MMFDNKELFNASFLFPLRRPAPALYSANQSRTRLSANIPYLYDILRLIYCKKATCRLPSYARATSGLEGEITQAQCKCSLVASV